MKPENEILVVNNVWIINHLNDRKIMRLLYVIKTFGPQISRNNEIGKQEFFSRFS